MTDTTKYYKCLKDDGSAIYGRGKWSLPVGKKKGAWMPRVENLSLCESGYHVTKAEHLIGWLNEAIYEVEVRGEVIYEGNKGVCHEARLVRKLTHWNERTARLFACDCAERVFHIWAKEYPEDKRPQESVRVARLFANGKATKEELDAARNAALAAAWDAARDAALAAAWDAAWAAAWDAEMQWQTKRLWQYLDGEIK